MGLLVSLTLIVLGVWLFAKQWGLIGGTIGRCTCEYCRTRRLMGPAMLVTIGILFLLDNTAHIEFHRTWPAILLVIGIVKLVQSNASSRSHIGPLPTEDSGLPPTAPPPASPTADTGTVVGSESQSSGEVKNV